MWSSSTIFVSALKASFEKAHFHQKQWCSAIWAKKYRQREKPQKQIKELWEERNKGRYSQQIVILLYVNSNSKLLARTLFVDAQERQTTNCPIFDFQEKKATFSAVYWPVIDRKNPFPSGFEGHERPTEILTSPICLLLISDVNIRMARRKMKNPSLIAFRNLVVWIRYHYLYNKRLPLIKSSLLSTFTMPYETLTPGIPFI